MIYKEIEQQNLKIYEHYNGFYFHYLFFIEFYSFFFRQTLDHLRREHEQTIQRLKQLKQEEISTALDVTTHTRYSLNIQNHSSNILFISRAFESVVDHMEQNAKTY